MQTNPNRRKFYAITAGVLVAVIGVAVFIVVYLDYSYVRIDVVGNAETSFVISYDSASTTLSVSENATVEVLPHSNVTMTARVTAPYTILHWDVKGAAFVQKGPDSINFLTGSGGSTIHVSVELVNSTG